MRRIRSSSKVSEMQGKPVGILLTHGHFDHIMAADEVRKKYNIPIYASEKEETTLLNPKCESVSIWTWKLYTGCGCLS